MVCEIIASAREDNVASATARRANPVSHPPGCTIFSEIAATLLFPPATLLASKPLKRNHSPYSSALFSLATPSFHYNLFLYIDLILGEISARREIHEMVQSNICVLRDASGRRIAGGLRRFVHKGKYWWVH
ncbi:hypothetical protein FMJ16_23280 [Klebsiella michiganensis]|nr:hypothetical protein [Klebsiella michiganensis]MBZ6644764.1 hypothetical protein [Klebsiella michiganensis]MBZ7240259.1 hypothetical protein [Klebsiella michiganensis]MBZ7299555.1 hypothetical protein [Klebsiella michiganensis]MBZ7354010.1 hypothetical protein [Klebsiella michiganensis]